MATGPTLPPQAYTREMLTTAFNWLQTQPDSVRKMATSPDTLVCLYTRAQRSGANLLDADAPVSSQAFMSDLKNLAEGLRAFDDPTTPAPVRQRPISAATVSPIHKPATPAAEDHRFFERHQPQQPLLPTQAPVAAVAAVATQAGLTLNERSLAMIQEVKASLNLTSDSEVTNLMVALAYKNLKNLLA